MFCELHLVGMMNPSGQQKKDSQIKKIICGQRNTDGNIIALCKSLAKTYL